MQQTNSLNSLLAAERSLIQRSLIDKSIQNGVIRMHKLIQKTIICRMLPKERQEVFSALVDILIAHIPKTHTVDLGQDISTWDQCESNLLHIETMLQWNSEYNIFPPTSQKLAELASRHDW